MTGTPTQTEDHPEEPNRSSTFPDLFAGGGIGLLLGTALSLSLTPVIAGFISAITSLLAVLLGLDGSSSGKRMLRVNALRIGAFGCATVIGLGLGLYVRTSEPLRQSPAELVQLWEKALPNNLTLAHQMALYERNALQPSSWAYVEGEAGTEATIDVARQKQIASVLQSSETTSADFNCEDLNPNALGANMGETIAKYETDEAPEIVRSIGAGLVTLADSDKIKALEIAYDFVCLVQDRGELFPAK
ncbi:hypothetical protein [uncultured Roseobacter sp.]|uniref:hypothetical protein n=1 Tax=uncultured Roseobacter sp. TaxID=114847 RepID=UPI00260F37ED|nr:hypothetical protein [uncultured Roseobacter sp.]